MWDELAAQASGGVCCAVCGRASISEDAASAAERAENETTNRIANLIPKSQSLGRASCQLYRYTTPSNSTPSTTSPAAHPERRLIAHRLANPQRRGKGDKSGQRRGRAAQAAARTALTSGGRGRRARWQHHRACAEEERDRRSGVSVCL